MLAVQVQYWTLQETAKHNRATEDLSNRTLLENIRHNQTTESETQRHNKMTESLERSKQIAEQVMNTENNNTKNMISLRENALGYAQLGVARDNARANLSNASANQRNAQTNTMNAYTNRLNALTQATQVANNYSLGLEANRISQQNADTSRYAAVTKASTDWFNAQTNRQNAEINQQNAETNYFNAVTNAERNELGYSELEQRKKEARQRLMLDYVRMGAQFFTDMTGNILKGIGALNQVNGG